jgi:hypothetical protein
VRADSVAYDHDLVVGEAANAPGAAEAKFTPNAGGA